MDGIAGYQKNVPMLPLMRFWELFVGHCDILSKAVALKILVEWIDEYIPVLFVFENWFFSN